MVMHVCHGARDQEQKWTRRSMHREADISTLPPTDNGAAKLYLADGWRPLLPIPAPLIPACPRRRLVHLSDTSRLHSGPFPPTSPTPPGAAARLTTLFDSGRALGRLWSPDTSVSLASPHAPLAYIPHATASLDTARPSVCRTCLLPLLSHADTRRRLPGGWMGGKSMSGQLSLMRTATDWFSARRFLSEFPSNFGHYLYGRPYYGNKIRYITTKIH